MKKGQKQLPIEHTIAFVVMPYNRKGKAATHAPKRFDVEFDRKTKLYNPQLTKVMRKAMTEANHKAVDFIKKMVDSNKELSDSMFWIKPLKLRTSIAINTKTGKDLMLEKILAKRW